MSNASLKERWWPDITDRETARKVSRQAFWAAIVVVGITVVFATLAAFGTSVAGITPGALLDAAIFGFIAVGIWNMSRVAAVAGLVLFGLERVLMARDNPRGGGLIVAIALLFAFANGVRATFAYHKLLERETKADEAAPTVPK